MGSNPTSRSDASIALEGAGLLGICLSKALTTVHQSSDVNQIDSPMEPSVSHWQLTTLGLRFSDVERIKDAFGKAIMASQNDGAKLDLHADIVGLSDHYNRVGQNWRLVGNKLIVEERRKVGLPVTKGEVASVSREGATGRNGKFVYLEKTQILAYGDK